MRLKQATSRRGSSVRAASRRRAHLGRVVGVVVEDERARPVRPCSSKRRPAPVKARSAGPPPGRRARRRGRPRALERVQHVVAPGNPQLHGHTLDGEARSPGVQVQPVRLEVTLVDPEADRLAAVAQPVEPRPEHAQPRGCGELGEGLLECEHTGVGRVVVELDVRHDRHVTSQLEERAVRLVGLDHSPIAATPRRRSCRRPAARRRSGRPARGRIRAAREAAIEAVVVLPWVPPTAIVRFIRESSASRSPR